MAQETAGTIGIPVLKNEVLPYLTDYTKRQERAQLQKQRAEQRAAELAAKKASEFSLPSMPGTEAGYAGPLIDAVRAKKVKELFNLAKSGVSQGDLLTVAKTDTIPSVESLNSYSKRLNSTIEDLNKKLQGVGVNATPQKAEEYFATARQDPNFFTKDHITGYEQYLRSKPSENINPSVIGDLLRKDVGKIKTTYETPDRVTQTLEYEKLFTPEEAPVPGRPDLKIIRASKIDPNEADKLFSKRSDLKVLADDWISDRKRQLASAPEFMLRPDDATKVRDLEQRAKNDFYAAAFPLAGNEVVAIRREQPGKGAGAGKQQFANINVSPQTIGYSTITSPSKAYRAIKPDDESKYNRIPGEAPVISVSPAEEGKLDISLAKGTNYIDIEGKPVDVEGTGKNVGTSTSPKIVGAEVSYPTGYKILKSGAQLVAPSIGYVAQAKEDISFPDGSFVRKGGIISPGLYKDVSINQVNLLPGVFGSTKELQYKLGPDRISGKFESPDVTTQKIFIPQNRVPDFFNNANAIMRERGLNLNSEMNKLKNQYMGMFGSAPAKAPAATKSKTAAPKHW